MPTPAPSNGRRIACVGAGPASLTVARDLAPLGYQVTVFEGEAKADAAPAADDKTDAKADARAEAADAKADAADDED
jgi:2-polyprenyl-6-methoxyphenol hydroxylase-like FAD-dependent oxidoreductase